MDRAAEPFPYRPGHFLQDWYLAAILDLVYRIETKAIEAKLLEPIERIVGEKGPNRGFLEADGCAPRGLPPGIEELRRIAADIVSVGAKVVIDHVEHHHQAALVGRVYEALQPGDPAIGGMGAVEQYAVVAPTATAGKLGHWHELDRSHPKPEEMIELVLDRIEGSLRREGTGVKLVDHGLFPRPPLPGAIPPVESAVGQQARTVDAPCLRPRRRVGDHCTVRQAEGILLAGPGLRHSQLMPPLVIPLHGKGSPPLQIEMQLLDRGRPQTKDPAPFFIEMRAPAADEGLGHRGCLSSRMMQRSGSRRRSGNSLSRSPPH